MKAHRAAGGSSGKGQRQGLPEGPAQGGLQRRIVQQLRRGVAAAVQQVVLQDGLGLGSERALGDCRRQAFTPSSGRIQLCRYLDINTPSVVQPLVIDQRQQTSCTSNSLPESASSVTKAASVGARNVTPSAGAGTAAELVASSVFTICASNDQGDVQHSLASIVRCRLRCQMLLMRFSAAMAARRT